jgi:hypothetical protein
MNGPLEWAHEWAPHEWRLEWAEGAGGEAGAPASCPDPCALGAQVGSAAGALRSPHPRRQCKLRLRRLPGDLELIRPLWPGSGQGDRPDRAGIGAGWPAGRQFW